MIFCDIKTVLSTTYKFYEFYEKTLKSFNFSCYLSVSFALSLSLAPSLSLSSLSFSFLFSSYSIQFYQPINELLMNRVKNDASWCLFQSDPERREKLANSTKRYFVTGYWLLSFPLSLSFSLSLSFFLFLSLPLYVYVCTHT